MTKGSIIWYSVIFLVIPKSHLCGQDKLGFQKLPHGKFIDKVELIVGPSVCLNHGNMFIDNYNENDVRNKRLAKIGYSIGVGAYHPVNHWLDINARVLWEQKGSKAELAHPLDPAIQFINSEYTYDYLTIYFAPTVFIGQRKRIAISLGGYYGKINDEKGHASIYDTKNIVQPSEGSFRGRYWYSFRDDGSTYSISFIPGKQSFEKDDYGASVGISYNLPIGGTHNLSIQLIDNYGLFNINNKKYSNNLPEKNHNLCLLIAFIFNRKKNN